MTGGCSEEKGAGKVQCTPGIRDSSLMLRMVIEHIDYPQEEEACLQVNASNATEAEEVSQMVTGAGGARVG